MSLAALLEWWNFIFALPLAVGGVLLLGLALSGMIDLSSDHANGDADHAGELHGDGGNAHHADVDAHADHAGELHADAGDADHAESADGEHGVVKTPYSSHDDHAAAEKLLWLKALNLFGIGMGLPLSMAVPLLMMVWGAVGLIANRLLEPLLQLPALFAPLSMGVALVTMAFAGRTAGLIIRRVLRDEAPPMSTSTVCRQHGARRVRNHARRRRRPCARPLRQPAPHRVLRRARRANHPRRYAHPRRPLRRADPPLLGGAQPARTTRQFA